MAKLTNQTNIDYVRKWREAHTEINRLRNRAYSKKRYIWKSISAEFRKIEVDIFQ